MVNIMMMIIKKIEFVVCKNVFAHLSLLQDSTHLLFKVSKYTLQCIEFIDTMIKVHPDQYSRNRQRQSRSIWISPPSSSKAVQSEFIINSSDRLISNKREKFAWIVRLESFVSSLAVSFKYLDSLKKIHATTFFIPQITQGETEKVSNIKSAFSNPFPN